MNKHEKYPEWPEQLDLLDLLERPVIPEQRDYTENLDPSEMQIFQDDGLSELGLIVVAVLVAVAVVILLLFVTNTL